jgi:hypothetical protein
MFLQLVPSYNMVLIILKKKVNLIQTLYHDHKSNNKKDYNQPQNTAEKNREHSNMKHNSSPLHHIYSLISLLYPWMTARSSSSTSTVEPIKEGPPNPLHFFEIKSQFKIYFNSISFQLVLYNISSLFYVHYIPNQGLRPFPFG